MALDPVTFTIQVEGDKTKEMHKGTFKAKPMLTHREELAVDRIRRDLLGAGSNDASGQAAATASILAELSVRLVDVPNWWKTSNGGLDLVDENVVATLYDKVMKIEKEAIDGVKQEGAEAKQELKSLVGGNMPAIDLSKPSLG
jgi:hypothetical protein